MPTSPKNGSEMNISELSRMKVAELIKVAKDMKLENISGLRKQGRRIVRLDGSGLGSARFAWGGYRLRRLGQSWRG